MTKNLTALLLVFVFAACTRTAVKQNADINKTKTMDGWKTFAEKNYSIQYPPTWELSQTRQMGTSFILFSPLKNNDDKFRENVNMIIEDLSGKDIDLNKYVEIGEGQIKTMMPNSAIIGSKRIKTEKDEHHKMIFTGDQSTYHLRFEQYYWIKDEKAYVLTFTCEENKFSDYKEIGKNILNSFSLTK